ncbi:hypothetical protein LEMLEM_LOCUS16790 [Lemmus lemmus]
MEDPPAAGDPEPAPAAVAATAAAAAPWAGPPLIGSRGRSSRARGTPLPAGHQVSAGSAPGRPVLAAVPGATRRARTACALARPPQKKPEKGSCVPHCGRETVRGPRGDNRGDVSCKGPIGRCQSVALRSDLQIARQSPGKAQLELERKKGASLPSYILECRVILNIETPTSLHPWSTSRMTPANEKSHSGARALYLDSLSEAPKVFAGGVLLDSLG